MHTVACASSRVSNTSLPSRRHRLVIWEYPSCSRAGRRPGCSRRLSQSPPCSSASPELCRVNRDRTWHSPTQIQPDSFPPTWDLKPGRLIPARRPLSPWTGAAWVILRHSTDSSGSSRWSDYWAGRGCRRGRHRNVTTDCRFHCAWIVRRNEGMDHASQIEDERDVLTGALRVETGPVARIGRAPDAAFPPRWLLSGHAARRRSCHTGSACCPRESSSRGSATPGLCSRSSGHGHQVEDATHARPGPAARPGAAEPPERPGPPRGRGRTGARVRPRPVAGRGRCPPARCRTRRGPWPRSKPV